MSFPGTSSRSKVVREMAAQARRAAIEGRWTEAIEINNTLIERSPRDVDALNRLGKAYYELGRYRSAYEAYTRALEADPASIIARRNLERIEPLRDQESEDPVQDQVQTPVRFGAFIQEAGKTYVDDLVNPAPANELRLIAAGDKLEIAFDDDHVVFVDADGNYVGAPEPRLGRRLAWLLEKGNTYEIFVVANAGDQVRVIVRELERSPEMSPGEMSFPEQVNAAIPRAYVRDSRLFRADEHDLIIPPDDDEDLEDVLAAEEDDEDEEPSEIEGETFEDDEDDDDIVIDEDIDDDEV